MTATANREFIIFNRGVGGWGGAIKAAIDWKSGRLFWLSSCSQSSAGAERLEGLGVVKTEATNVTARFDI